MESIAITKFRAACATVLEKVRRTGEPVLITRAGEPVAEIVPVSLPARPERWLGAFRSSGKIQGDILSPAVDDTAWDVLRA